MSLCRRVDMEKETKETIKIQDEKPEEPRVLEEIVVEELSIDGVCGVY
jgi:mycofactocin precursor